MFLVRLTGWAWAGLIPVLFCHTPTFILRKKNLIQALKPAHLNHNLLIFDLFVLHHIKSMHYCPKCHSTALLVHKTFHALVLSDHLHCRASGTALDKKLVWISYSTWMKSSLSLLTATFCLAVLPFFLLWAGHSWKTAFWLHLERALQTTYIGIFLVMPLQQEHLDGQKQNVRI